MGIFNNVIYACRDVAPLRLYFTHVYKYFTHVCKDVAVQRLYFVHVFKDVTHIICFFFEKKPSKSLLFENFGLILYKGIHIFLNHQNLFCMKIPVNLDKALPLAQIQDILNKLEDIRQQLKDFGVSLTSDERQKSRKLGKRRYAFAEKTLRAAKNYERFLPRDINVQEYERAFEEYNNTNNLKMKARELNELFDDTNIAVGILVMQYTDACYEALQSARKRDGSLDGVVNELEEFNKQSASVEEPDTDANFKKV